MQSVVFSVSVVMLLIMCQKIIARKRGVEVIVRKAATVIKVSETNIFIGQGDWAKQVFEIILETEDAAGMRVKFTIRQYFERFEPIPKAGDSVWIDKNDQNLEKSRILF